MLSRNPTKFAVVAAAVIAIGGGSFASEGAGHSCLHCPAWRPWQ
jgi:hypothetical protein